MKQSEIERLLPLVLRRTLRPGSPLAALLAVMEALQAPAEEVLAGLDAYFSPYRAPDEFVPFLARWTDLAWLLADAPEQPFAAGLGRLREVIAAAADLSRARGTAAGLVRFLETATGLSGFVIEEAVPGADGRPRAFHMRVRPPAGAEPYRALIVQIVEMEKPVYVTYELS